MAVSTIMIGLIVENVTLATNVAVSAGSTTSALTIPSKSGYRVASVQPWVSGASWGVYSAMTNADTTQIYFRNNHTSAHTNTFGAVITYVKD